MPVSTSASAVRVVPDMPPLVRAYIDATNSFDLDALVETFADTAVVNDQQREHAGRAAIRGWAAREIIADRVTMSVTSMALNGDNAVVTAGIDGNYDKMGLPDPLILTFYFTVHGDRIGQLVILRNKAPQDDPATALAPPLDDYFEAKNQHDTGAMLACFAEDAVVVDEAQEHRGQVAIRAWIAHATNKYRVTVDIISVEVRDRTTIVTGLVSGNFPGSPGKLRYAFSVSDCRIKWLEIV